jgi:hypothetical protein
VQEAQKDIALRLRLSAPDDEGDEEECPAWLQISLFAEAPPCEIEIALFRKLFNQGQLAVNEYLRFADRQVGGIGALPPTLIAFLRELQAAHVQGFAAIHNALQLLTEARSGSLAAYVHTAAVLMRMLTDFASGVADSFEHRIRDVEELSALGIQGLPDELVLNGRWTKAAFWLRDVMSEDAILRLGGQAGDAHQLMVGPLDAEAPAPAPAPAQGAVLPS